MLISHKVGQKKFGHYFSFEMTSLGEALAYINPFFFYYSFAFAIGKIYQWLFNAESVWENFWNKIIDVTGEDREVFSVWILNSYSYFVYWSFGCVLLVMELSKKPKILETFKIQSEKGLERLEDVFKVSKSITACFLFGNNANNVSSKYLNFFSGTESCFTESTHWLHSCSCGFSRKWVFKSESVSRSSNFSKNNAWLDRLHVLSRNWILLFSPTAS